MSGTIDDHAGVLFAKRWQWGRMNSLSIDDTKTGTRTQIVKCSFQGRGFLVPISCWCAFRKADGPE
jgi:hypothetical protein